MLMMRLELLGDFEVLAAEDGQKGCEMAATEQPDMHDIRANVPASSRLVSLTCLSLGSRSTC
jgi:hypothetical protein